MTQRAHFDREKGRAFKSNAWLRFGLNLVMDRYVEPEPTDDDAVERSRQSETLHAELEVVRARLDELDKLTQSKVSVGSISIGQSLPH